MPTALTCLVTFVLFTLCSTLKLQICFLDKIIHKTNLAICKPKHDGLFWRPYQAGDSTLLDELVTNHLLLSPGERLET